MIFVVGARRSGTNWLGRIVGAHPDVASVQSETYLFSEGLAPLTARFQHASLGSWQVGSIYMERAAFIDALRTFCDSVFAPILHAAGDRPRLLERTPDHGRYLELIGEIYPDARVANIIRDGRDVARSLVAMEWGPKNVGEGAAEWVEAVTAARRAASHLAHYHEIRYEDLLASPREEIAALYGAIDLTVTPEVVEAALTESGVPYNRDPTMPEVASGKWRSALSEKDIRAVEAVAGPTLRELGYAMSSGAPNRPLAGAAARSRDALRARLRPQRNAEVTVDPTAWGQYMLDQFLAAVRGGKADEAREVVNPTAVVQVVTGSSSWEGRGEAAVDRFLDTLVNDPAVTGRQTRSDVFPSSPAFTVVFATEEGTGVNMRTLVVYFRDRLIIRAAYYAAS